MSNLLSIQKLTQHFSKNDKITIFDIGAFDFSESISFKRYFPNADVYGIEADKINYNNSYKVANSEGIKTFNLAMADFNGKTTFWPSLRETKMNKDWRYAGSIVKPILKENSNEAINHTVTFDTEGYEVETIKFDTFCENNGITNVDFIHIDVEGAEDKVLSNLGKYKPLYIYAETEHFKTKNYENKLTLDEFDLLMDSLGYKINARLMYDTLYEKK
jgi:FkbM family methyltransferase